MRRPPGEANALDRAAATGARLARSAVDAELVLVSALQAAPADVVADRRAARFDGSRQDAPDGGQYPVGFGRRQRCPKPARVDAGRTTRLVRIDIADTGEDGLVEKEGLQRTAGRLDGRTPLGGGGVPRFGAQFAAEEHGRAGLVGIVGDAAEAAGIAEPQFVAVVERERQVRVVGSHGPGRGDRELTGHAEVDEQDAAIVEFDEQPLAPPRDGLNATADHMCPPRFRPRPTQGLLPRPHGQDSPANEERPQIAGDSLDFGEFGHGFSLDIRRGCFKFVGQGSPLLFR